MSELNDLLTTRELQRWRLILGEAAETTLCGLDDNARQIDHALEWLYGRDPERLQRGERSGGLGGSNLTTPEWINSIHTLFPQQVIERLVSLGMRCWQDIEHYGLRIWFTDPDTGSILHLSRSWPRSEQENSPAATRRLFSFQAGALAGGQIVSQAAKRSADGELLLATRNRLSSVVPLSPDAWRMLSAPLRQPGIVALREYLRQRPPSCIRPLNQVDNLFILPVAECISLGWDSSRQTLDAQVISGEGEDNLLTLSLPASASAPYAVERMAALLQQTDDPVCLVSGFVSFVDGQLTLEPQVMMTKTRAWALDAETAPVVASLPSASVLPVPSTAHQLLMRCQALLIQLLHNGWRYQEQSAIGQAELLANDLTAVGFYRLAHVLGQFRNTESEARVEAMNNGVLLCEQLFPLLQQQG